MMSAPRPCLIFLIVLCCYGCCGFTNAIRHESEKTRAAGADKAQENQFSINSDSYHVSSNKPHFELQPATTSILQLKEVRQKRSQYDFLNDYGNDNGNNNNLNELNDDVEDNDISQASIASPTTSTIERGDLNFDIDDLPPYTYFLLLQKLRQLQSHEPTYRVRTPRLGRSIDLQLLNDIGAGRGVQARNYNIDGRMTRQSKKSVPFKPRLGKRTKFNCNN